jgi:hypothetical protein
MQKPELFLVFIRPLNHLEIPYMITGSTAAIIYGEPRLTHDIDLVVDLTSKNVELFYNAFNNSEFYVPPKEVLKIEISRAQNGHCNLLHQKTGFKADIYMKGNDRLHVWAFKKRETEKIEGDQIWLAPLEYVIIRKLMYYKEGKSEKHLQDIRNILRQNQEKVKRSEIETIVNEYNLSESWNLIVNLS